MQSLNLTSGLSAAGLGNFSGSITLELDMQGPQGSLLVQAGSVDQTGTYVFEVMPRGVQESASKSIGYWSTANGDDTMVSIWNPADEAQDFVFRLVFSGGQYLYPVHLGPRATQSFNISQLIQAQVPDSQGNIIPASIQEGSAVLGGAQARRATHSRSAGFRNLQRSQSYVLQQLHLLRRIHGVQYGPGEC